MMVMMVGKHCNDNDILDNIDNPAFTLLRLVNFDFASNFGLLRIMKKC